MSDLETQLIPEEIMADKMCDLVFEGGGAKGAVFVGALMALENRGFQSNLLVGTSAGAITAVMLAAGYSPADMNDIAQEKTDDGKPRFSTFLDPPSTISPEVARNSELFAMFSQTSMVNVLRDAGAPIPSFLDQLDDRIRTALINQLLRLPAARTLMSFGELGGLYEGTAFLEWVREKLDKRTAGLGDSTLAEFHETTRRDLTVVASDTTGTEMLVLNHRTAPQCPTAWAVRMSMSIPFLWDEVTWDANWGRYRDRDLTGHKIVDGGVLSNFPLGLLTNLSDGNAELMGRTTPSGARVLGLLIDTTLEVPGAGTANPTPQVGIDNLAVARLKTVKRVRRLMDTMSEAHDNQVIAAHSDLVCHLPAMGYGTTEFDMSAERMNALIAAGQAAMENFLQAHP
jgi:predicted acylesterase/phospholipase RssA